MSSYLLFLKSQNRTPKEKEGREMPGGHQLSISK
jgi:hypothetical protein